MTPRHKTRLRALGVGLALAVVVFAVALAAAVAMVRASGSVAAAHAWVLSARPYFLTAQLMWLAALWIYWAQLVAWLAKRRGLGPAHAAVLESLRGRVFLMLGACEAVIVARAIAG